MSWRRDGDIGNTIQPTTDKACTSCLPVSEIESESERQNDISPALDMMRTGVITAATKITIGQQLEEDYAMGSSITGSFGAYNLGFLFLVGGGVGWAHQIFGFGQNCYYFFAVGVPFITLIPPFASRQTCSFFFLLKTGAEQWPVGALFVLLT